MKLKTKLIASIMSICLVCAVFAIGVFALKTANLKIGGDVSFNATGVEATIEKYAVTTNAVGSEEEHFKKVVIDTNITQVGLNGTEEASSWGGLNITVGEAGKVELDVAVTNNADEITEAYNYIEVDAKINLGTGDNFIITIKPKNVTIDSVEHKSDYIIAPGETDYFTISFLVEDIELDASLEDFNFCLILKHTTPKVATETNNVVIIDNIKYTLNKEKKTASVSGHTITQADTDAVIYPIVMSDAVDAEPCIVSNMGVMGTFKDCTNLRSITIPNSISSFGLGDFSGCSNLETVILPCSIRDLSGNLFSNCINLTTITISNSVTKIPFNTFLNCSSLTSLTIPSSVIEIENGAFSGTGLTSVVIPRSVNNIWGTAFSNCNNLVTAKFENPTNWRLLHSPDKVDITPGFSEGNAEILKSIVFNNYLLRG